MTRSFPTFFSTPAAWISLLGLTVTMASCGGAYRQASALEDDELYLSQGEEFLTDEEYLSYAFEQAGFSESEELDVDARAGDGFNSNFGYVPQSLRGRSMLRGYMTPYGAAGFGPNPYDPYGSACYGGYNPYDPYGSSMGWNNGWSNSWGSPSGWGMNPYMGYGFGSGFGYNPYAYNPYGFNNGWGGGYNVYQGSGWLGGGESFGGTPVVVAPRTPIWASSSINSATGGGRLLTNKMEAGGSSNVTGATQPRVFWRTVSDAAETLEGSWDENRPEQSTPETTRSTSRSSSGAGQSGWSSSPSRSSSSWSSGSRPSNSGSNRSSTRPSTPSRPSSGGRSTGGSSRSGGRGGSPRR
ncbi:MAG: hypothetical protein CL835_00580 [Crocinitomicaceae bacterium]|nr:hypothetical protein [Crocinitomicaceae bacterium]